MTKKEYVKKIADEAGMTHAKVEEFLEAQQKTLMEISEEDSLILRYHGTYKMVRVAEKKGRNPKTGEEIIIPAKKAVKFKVGKKLDDKVNA